GRRDGLAHFQGRAGRRVHLVAVVRLEDFHVVARIQDARRDVEQLERGVHAHAHVGGEHDGDLLGRHFDGGAAVVVEAGGADDHAGAVAHAGLQVGGGGFGAGEVDQAVGV